MSLMRTIVAALLLIVVPVISPAQDVPPLQGRVNDMAGLLSPGAVQHIERKLAGFEGQTGSQIVVLTVPTLQGEEIEQFAIRVADAWKPGQKGKDNGVILIIAKAERKVRIEVGMGLQGALPDVTASRIIRDVMRPHLKAGDFDRAVDTGIEAIMSATRGEFTAPQHTTKSRPHGRTSGVPTSFLTLLALVAVAAIAAGFMSRALAAAAGAVGVPLATLLSFGSIGIIPLLALAAAGMAAGLVLSALFSGGGGFDGGGSSDDY